MNMWIPITTVQRSPLNWERPDEADPSRFAPANVIHPGAWVPFSGGQRNCIGMRFALLEATLILAVMAQNFSFSSVCKEKTLPCGLCGVIQKPLDGVKVVMTPRIVPSPA